MKPALALLFRICGIAILALLMGKASLAEQNPAADQQKVPLLNGGAGPCSVDFTVSDPGGKPLLDAKVRVHIAYGFLGKRTLDLEIGTNTAGKARLEGLPAKIHEATYFHISKGELEGSALFDPEANCHEQHDIILEKPAPAPSNPPGDSRPR